MQAEIQRRYRQWSGQGFRVLGVARQPRQIADYTHGMRLDFSFSAFCCSLIPLRPMSSRSSDLGKLGVSSRSSPVTISWLRGMLRRRSTCVQGLLTGNDLNGMGDEALWHAAERTSIFAEVDPNQKERIILAFGRPGTSSDTWAMGSTTRRRCMPRTSASR